MEALKGGSLLEKGVSYEMKSKAIGESFFGLLLHIFWYQH